MKIQYSIFILLFLISCTAKTGKINQYAKDNNGVRQRNGIWEEKYASDIGELIGKGKYKNGQKVGLWVTKYQDKVYQKERFKKNISKVKIYHKNGVLREKGQTKTNEMTHRCTGFMMDLGKFMTKTANIFIPKSINKELRLIVFLQSKSLVYFLGFNGFSLVITNPLR